MGTNIEDHNDAVCASIGHAVACVTLVRCGHRESFTATSWVSLSGGDDAWEPVQHQEMQFGPFDSIEEITEAVTRMMRDAVTGATELSLQ